MQILIRLPNWLGDIIMAWPVIQGIQQTHPQAHIHLLGLPAFASLIQVLDPNLPFYALPKKNFTYYWQVMRVHRGRYDIQVIFTNSERGDIEARLINAAQRIGVEQGKRRRVLTLPYVLPSKIKHSQQHQTHIWQAMAQQAGLIDGINLHTSVPLTKDNAPIGLICGSENSPQKRWPKDHWRELIQRILAADNTLELRLFGTSGDATLCAQIAQDFNPQQVINRAGQTNLEEFAQEMQACRLVVANDTGGMHLANALGIRVIALFAPTNPVSTGPIFAGATVLQPAHCPATGGMQMQEISVAQVLKAVMD